MRGNPKRSFKLCYDNRLVVLVDAFCNHFAELLAVGAEDGKTNGRTGGVGLMPRHEAANAVTVGDLSAIISDEGENRNRYRR
jgi:hypothetical protein